MLSFLFARLAEPSTYAGLGLIYTGIHNAITGALQTGLAQIGAGFVAAIVPEAGAQPAPAIIPKKA